MKKTGQVATKSKMNAVQINKKNKPAKAPAMKAKANVSHGKKNVAAKILAPAKNGKNSDDDEENSEEESNDEVEQLQQASDDPENDAVEDSDEDDDNDDDIEEKKEDDAIEEEGSDEEENDDSEDEGPEEQIFEKGSKIKAQPEPEDSDDDDEEAAPKEKTLKKGSKIKAQPEPQPEDSDDDDEDAAPKEKKLEKASKTSPLKKDDKLQNDDCKVYVKKLSKDTTEDVLRQHFASCGEIEMIRIHHAHKYYEATIVFGDAAASQAALKMHNTILNDSTILVYHATVDRRADPDRTLVIMNPEGLQKLEGAKLEKIFSKFGEINYMNVVCGKKVLAFVTFKDAESVKKAMQVNGTTQNGLQIEISSYDKVPKTKILVSNIANGTTETELRTMFEVCGPIQSIVLRQKASFPPTAVITFKNQEGYCQSFLLHEEKLRGRYISVHPFTDNPKSKFQKKPFQKAPFKGKRPQQGMWKSGPPAKKNKK